MSEKQNSTPTTQVQRRTIYGLNVAIAVVLAALIVVGINYLIDTQFHLIPPTARKWVRYDWTSTRKYSLSDQTTQLLKELDNKYEIYTIFDTNYVNPDVAQALQHVRDLINEYALFSDKLEVVHIDPNLDQSRQLELFKKIREHFKDELAPLDEATQKGRATLNEFSAMLPGVLDPLQAIVDNPALEDNELIANVRQVHTIFTRFVADWEEENKSIDRKLNSELPNFVTLYNNIEVLLKQLDEQYLPSVISMFDNMINRESTPAAVKDKLIAANEQLKQAKAKTTEGLSTFNLTQRAPEYNTLRSNITSTESIVVLGPKQAKTIMVSSMYRQPDPEEVQRTGNTESRFIGEEKLTGTLMSMSMENQPMVVYALTGQQGAIGGRGGAYQEVTERLRNANFDVRQWFSAGYKNMSPDQQPPAPPELEEEQKGVWILLPAMPGEQLPPMMMMTGGMKQDAVEHIRKRLAAGDNALFIVDPNPMVGRTGREDPVAALLDEYGITVQQDRIVLQEQQLPDRRTVPSPQFEVTQWPDELPITSALAGLNMVLLQSSPIVIDEQVQGVKHYPLIELTGDRLWAEDDLLSPDAMENASYTEEKGQDRFLAGVAAEKDGSRIIVISDPVWASDNITTYGAFGPGTAELLGARWPGNSELFVNCMYWLAEFDQLIASSARSQDIRRVEPMTTTAYYWTEGILIGGLPLIILAIGVGVWMSRRQG